MNDTDIRIKVIGVGGGGISAVNRMIASGLQGVAFIAADTDEQTLAQARAKHTILLRTASRKDLSVNNDTDGGREAAQESLPVIKDAIGKADIVFVVAGMGGNAGSGMAPVIAKAANDADTYLIVGVVSSPFAWEAEERQHRADVGIHAFRDAVDCLIVIPNDKLIPLSVSKSHVDMLNEAAEALHQVVRSLSDPITTSGLIGLDLADERVALCSGGTAACGIGTASGADRARTAAMRALACPLLEGVFIGDARGVFICITSNSDIGIEEVVGAASIIQEAASERAFVVFSVPFDESMGDEIRVTLIASCPGVKGKNG